MIKNIQEWLSGKKTYITGCIAILGAVLAWAVGSIDVMKALELIWAALASMFIRAGVAKVVTK